MISVLVVHIACLGVVSNSETEVEKEYRHVEISHGRTVPEVGVIIKHTNISDLRVWSSTSRLWGRKCDCLTNETGFL